jgi:hypothetical protein
MKIYHYDVNTKILTGESLADESPLQKGVFLVPANCTTLEPIPPIDSNDVQVFENGEWVLKNDNRGTYWDSSGIVHNIVVIGIDPNPTWTKTPPKTYAPLSAWQVRKVLNQLNLRDSVEYAVSQASQDTKDAWNYAKEFERNDDVLLAMASVLNITSEQLDGMFELGITL